MPNIEQKLSSKPKETPETTNPREMLDRWGANLHNRGTITEFWVWLLEKKATTPIYDINIEKELDEYHEINQKQLDQERKALLAEI